MEFFIYCASVWMIYYLINHSQIFEKLRLAAMPALPEWLQTLLGCSLCFCWWVTVGLSLFVGFSMVVFAAPPCVLFADLTYRKLVKSDDDNTQPPILK